MLGCHSSYTRKRQLELGRNKQRFFIGVIVDNSVNETLIDVTIYLPTYMTAKFSKESGLRPIELV